MKCTLTLGIWAVKQDRWTFPAGQLSLIVEREFQVAQVLGEGVGLNDRYNPTAFLFHEGWVGALGYLGRRLWACQWNS